MVLACGSVMAGDLPDTSVDSVIYLSKNTNKNQVHYAVHVDESCRPAKAKPVRPYWRDLEIGQDATSKLMFWEQPGYGVRQPKEVNIHDNGGSFTFHVRGVPERKIRLETFMLRNQCRARATTTIADEDAVFQRIEIDVSGWANVHRVEIFGVSVSTGNPVREITHQD
jgi:hypothetical protein